MLYNIIFIKKERLVVSVPWSGTLDIAKKHAKDHMIINKADSVEVRDDDNHELLFHHPRTLDA